jgi:hypothetical protein
VLVSEIAQDSENRVLAKPEILRAASTAIVEKIVDNFLQSSAKNPFPSLVNTSRFLLAHASPYLSVEILEYPSPSGDLP